MSPFKLDKFCLTGREKKILNGLRLMTIDTYQDLNVRL